MVKNNFHKKAFNSPPPSTFGLPLVQKLVATYRLWHEFLPHLPKISRYTLGSKIDCLLTELSESVVRASYLPREEKIDEVQKAAVKSDLVKFFLRLAWEIKAIDNKKYVRISEHIDEIGRMIGGWLKHLSNN